ncbi:unnamed protein product [Penicillium palitans]
MTASRHLVALATHPDEMNPLFLSPIGYSPTAVPLNKRPQHILDIGTGNGTWAIFSDVADIFPCGKYSSSSFCGLTTNTPQPLFEGSIFSHLLSLGYRQIVF